MTTYSGWAGSNGTASPTFNTRWTNPTNALGANDGASATSSMVSGNNSDYIRLYNFGLAVPSDKVVIGLTLDFWAVFNNNSAGCLWQWIINFNGSNSPWWQQNVTDPGGSAVVHQLAGWPDNTGSFFRTLSPSDVNDSTFGFAVTAFAVGTCVATLDACQLTVWTEDEPVKDYTKFPRGRMKR